VNQVFSFHIEREREKKRAGKNKKSTNHPFQIYDRNQASHPPAPHNPPD
jgi:hypothetical protein